MSVRIFDPMRKKFSAIFQDFLNFFQFFQNFSDVKIFPDI